MNRKPRTKKPIYYKMRPKKKTSYVFLQVLVMVLFLVGGIYLIRLSADRFDVIKKRPSEGAI